MIIARFQQSRIRGADVFIRGNGRVWSARIEADEWPTLEGTDPKELGEEATRLGARSVAIEGRLP